MSERAFSRSVVAGFRREGADVQRREDAYSTGIPDLSVAYADVDAWIELKYLPSWPARPTTPVRYDRDRRKFARQLEWLYRRGATGAAMPIVLVRIGRTDVVAYVVDDRATVAALRDGAPRAGIVARAVAAWRAPTFPAADVLAVIVRGPRGDARDRRLLQDA